MPILQHSEDFMREIYNFCQAHPGSVGVSVILRLPDGNFIRQAAEMKESDFKSNSSFDGFCHEMLSGVISAARQGPGSAEVVMPRGSDL